MTDTTNQTLKVAHQAFQHFTHGLATGEWQAFTAMLTDDFTFWFPLGTYAGENVGKERAIAFFQYVAKTFDQGLTLTLDTVTHNDTTVVFQFRDEGVLWGNSYKNRVAVSFDVQGDKICAYREYLGGDGKIN